MATNNSLNIGANAFIDDDTMATASATSMASSESIKAYVDAQITGVAADQAEMEAATATDVYSAPGRQQFHPGHPKGWVYYDQVTPTILASYNVTSVTDSSTGIFIVNWTTAFSSVNYSTVATTQSAGGGNNLIGIGESGTKGTTSATFTCVQLTSQIDRPFNNVAAFGDQ